jgi:hypothetical protein
MEQFEAHFFIAKQERMRQKEVEEVFGPPTAIERAIHIRVLNRIAAHTRRCEEKSQKTTHLHDTDT